MTLAIMLSILKRERHITYTKPFQLNIVGFRNKTSEPGVFKDEIHCFYKDDSGKWQYHVWPATTDPGTYWLHNPQMPQGTAILTSGQYVDTYAIGLHKGTRPALVQVKPVTVLRDFDRDSVIDFKATSETGLFGINIHYPSGEGGNKYIGLDSAGCQVFQWNTDFVKFMALAEVHRARHGNRFTYTLIDFRARRRWWYRNASYAGIVAGSLGLGAYYKRKEIRQFIDNLPIYA